jgi:ParB family chromosome partitioning protein
MRNSAIQPAHLKSIRLARINSQDDTFRITTRTDTDELQVSIKHEGLLNPPLVIRKTSAFTIVSGFRRIAACRKIGYAEITARVLEPHLSSLECLRIAIAENAFQRPLNLIETSRSLHKLSSLLNNSKSLAESASSLGLPANPSIISKVRDLCILPWLVQSAILEDTISLSMAVELGFMGPDIAIAFARLFSQLKIGLNKQKEIVALVKEIAERDSISIYGVMEDDKLQALLNSEDLDRAQKARILRSILRQKRFPRIVAAEDNFAFYRKKLKLGNDIKLIPPKEFEGTAYSLTLTFTDPAHLKVLQSRLHEIIENPWFEKIFKIK